MKLFITSLLILLVFKINSKDFTYKSTGTLERNEVTTFPGGGKFISFKHSGGFETDIGKYGKYQCNGSILYNNVDRDNLLTGVLTPPRHSPIQILNYSNNNSNDNSSNNITHEKESFQTPPRSTSPIPVLLKVTSKATLSNLKNFKTPFFQKVSWCLIGAF